MPGDRHINYPLASDTAHVEQMRKLIREAIEVLKLPETDTFLGRKTHEPFPPEEPKD
ncbi:hypothetical protein RAD16_26160 [Bradyrhizobium sp. 18BD]